MPPISFNQVPLDIFSPGIYMEIDPSLSKTGLPIFKQRIVLMGQMGTAAQATAGQMDMIITAAEAKTRYGADSMLYAMVKSLRAVNPYQELLVVPLADNPAGVAAIGTITITGTATASSTQPIYIGDKRYQIGITSGELAASVAGRLVTLINNDLESIVVANNVGAAITLTCKWKGETGNDISLLDRFYKDDYGTRGITFAVVAMSGGAGNPDITLGLDALDDLTQYQAYAIPYTDTVNLDLLRTELDDRWGPLRAMDGRVYTGKREGVAALTTHVLSRNDQNYICMDTDEDAATPPWQWAASVAGTASFYGAIDPGRPFQTLELIGIMGAPEGQRRLSAERETLLRNGCSTNIIGDDGKVRIHRAVTSYNLNEAGAEDQAYKSLNTVMLMSYYRRSVINRFQLKYPRHKLAVSGHPAAGLSSNIITPETGIAEFLAHYKLMMDRGLMDDFDGYKQDIIANKNADMRGRLDVFDRPRPIDQFHQLAVRAAFKLI